MKKKLRVRQVIAMLLTVVMLFNTVTMDIFATGTNDAETIKVIEDVVAADDDTSDGGGASESEDGASDGNGAAAESDSDASGDSGDALDPGLSVDDIPDADAEPGSEVSGGILEGSSDIVSLSLEDYDDPAPVVGEDVSKREANIKYFLNEDLTYTAAIYPMTVHYYEDGQWKDIDNGFKAAVLDGDSSYIENKANRMKVRFAQDTQQTKLVQISIGGYQLSWGMDTGSRISARRMTDNTNDLMDKAMPVIDASLDTEVPPGITERMDAAASEIVDDGSEKETRETLEGESEKETEETSDPGSEKGTKETSDTVTEKETQETMDTEPEKEDPSIISRETLGLQSGAASIDLTAETDAGLAPKDHEPVGVHTAASAATETATQESLMLMGLASQMMMTAGSTVAAAPDAVYISNDDPGEETLDGAYHLAKIKDDAASMDLDTLGSRVVYDNIYSGVSLEYVLCGETLKENIILASAQSNRTFMYDCMAEGLTPQLADNRISFKDPSGQEVLGIQAPFMYDAAGIYSDAVTLGLEPAGSGWRISITADQDWLLAADRQYPVVIDPVISTSTAHADIQDARVSSLHPDTNYINEYVLSTGYSSSTGTNYSFMKFQLPDLDSSDIIVDATVDLTVFTSSGLSTKVDLHDVTADWDSSTITWNNKPAYDPVVADYDSFVDIEENHCYFVITDIVKGWYRGEPNYGVMAKDAKEASDSYRAFYSSDYTVASVCPQIKITYINATGLEAFWTYHSQSIGRAGTGYVNDYTGNMVLVHSTAATSGNRMPASLTHVYNSNDSAINLGYGHGFRLNYHQRLEPVTIADTQYYKYTDEDGTRHYFKKDTSKNKWLVDSGIDLELTIGTASDEKYTIKDKSDQKLIFDDAGHLVKVQDANGNALTIGYSNDRISRITDGAGRIMTLTYDSSGNLASVVSPDGTKTFTYTGGDLTKITDIDGRSVDYTYAGHLMTAAVNIDGYKMQYTYTTGLMDRVTKISEYAGSVQGQSVSIVYDDNSTTFTDHRSRTETYAFNDAGHTVTIYNDEGYAESAKYLTAEGTNKNKLSKASKLQYTVVQMAHDPEGTSLTSWHGTNGYALNTDAANARVGTTSLKLIGDANASAFHQNIFIEKGKTYTFSAYVRPEGTLADGKNCYVRLRYQDGSNNEVVTSSSEMIPCEDGWYRLECTATVPTDSMSDDVYVFMLVDPGVTAYFDCMQLESGDTASRYDLVENGDHMALADSKTLTFSGNTMYDSVVDLDALNSGSYALTSKVSSGLVTTSALNVRSGPGTGYSINASVSKDQRVYIFDTVVDTSGITWYNIAWCSGERVYYGYASAVYINKDQSDTVTVERALSDTSLLYVRAGAGTGYGAIGVVSYKNEVQIIDTVTANGQEWYVVHYTKNGLGYTGCALSDLVLTYADVMTQSRIPERSHNDDLDDHVVMMYGYSDDVKKATQTIDIAGSKGDAYMFNAWGCGLSVALREDTRHFGVEVRFFGTDGKEYAHVSDFKENGDAWMFLNDVAVADADYSKIEISYIYSNNENVAFFDGLSLFREEFGSSYVYDDEGNVTTTKDAAAKSNEFAYDSSNNLTMFTDAKGSKFTYTYDTKHNVTAAVSAANMKYTFSYDSYGNAAESKIINASNAEEYIKTVAAYSSDGNFMTSLTDPLGNTIRYDYNEENGRLDTATDAMGTATDYAYSTKGQVTSVRTAVTDTNGQALTAQAAYTYTDDQLTGITWHGQTYSFVYDGFGNQTAVRQGDTTLVSYVYGANNGNLVQENYGNGHGFIYSYDRYDRLTQVRFRTSASDAGTVLYDYKYNKEGNLSEVSETAEGRKYRYFYDLTDRLVKVVGSNGGYYTYYYDANDNLVKVLEMVNSAEYKTQYSYDSDNRETVTTMNNGRTYTTTYDALGRITKKSWSTETAYDTTLTYSPGADGSQSSQLASITNGGSTISYTYNANGNITSITDDAGTTTYEYDGLNQLTRENNHQTGQTVIYLYDACGNILSKKIYAKTDAATVSGTPQDTVTYSYDTVWTDKLISYDGAAVTYDTVGNPLSYRGNTLTWTKGNMLERVVSGSSDHTYSYNHDGIRVEKKNNSTGARVIYQLTDGLLAGEKTVSTSGSESNHLVYSYDSSDTIIGVNYNGRQYYCVKNGQGDIIGLVNRAGSVVTEYTYDSWGRVLTITGDTALGNANPFRYRGYYYDTETGFYYLYGRYYDPEVGRFINADDTETLELEADIPIHVNLFAYCLNNPVNMADDSGNLPFFVATGIAGAVIGGVVGFAATGTLKGALAGAAIGGVVGMVGGAGAAYLLAGKATASVGAVSIGTKLQIAGMGSKGYKSLSAFKNANGAAGKGRAWHHIVGETAGNIKRFGSQTIHKANNLVNITHGKGSLHNMITGHYNSKFTYTNGMTVHKWIESKSFRYQYNYGLELLAKYSKQLGESIRFTSRR